MKIVVSAGELSGDEHAGQLLRALRDQYPALEARAMGGRHLREAGAAIVIDSEKSASTMGFAELFWQLGALFRLYAAMKRLLREWRPDVLVLVDFPDFNLRLARYAKSLGIKTFYFIIPKMWAWRSGRISQFQRYIDHAAVIFPFEKQFCAQHGYDRVTYVGHPFATEFRNLPPVNRGEFLSGIDFNPSKPVFAILPGSRRGEIERLLKVMLDGFRMFQEKYPEVQGIIPVASSINRKLIESFLPADGSIRTTEGDALTVMRVADAGFIKSGTSNLQAAFCDLPFVMLYNVTASTAWILRRFVSLTEYSIVNIIRPHTVTEILQDEATTARIAQELEILLTDEIRRAELRASLSEVRQLLAEPQYELGQGKDAYERAAQLLIQMVG